MNGPPRWRRGRAFASHAGDRGSSAEYRSKFVIVTSPKFVKNSREGQKTSDENKTMIDS